MRVPAVEWSARRGAAVLGRGGFAWVDPGLQSRVDGAIERLSPAAKPSADARAELPPCCLRACLPRQEQAALSPRHERHQRARGCQAVA